MEVARAWSAGGVGGRHSVLRVLTGDRGYLMDLKVTSGMSRAVEASQPMWSGPQAAASTSLVSFNRFSWTWRRTVSNVCFVRQFPGRTACVERSVDCRGGPTPVG